MEFLSKIDKNYLIFVNFLTKIQICQYAQDRTNTPRIDWGLFLSIRPKKSTLIMFLYAFYVCFMFPRPLAALPAMAAQQKAPPSYQSLISH